MLDKRLVAISELLTNKIAEKVLTSHEMAKITVAREWTDEEVQQSADILKKLTMGSHSLAFECSLRVPVEFLCATISIHVHPCNWFRAVRFFGASAYQAWLINLSRPDLTVTSSHLFAILLNYHDNPALDLENKLFKVLDTQMNNFRKDIQRKIDTKMDNNTNEN